jgi:hypothetical protein
MTRDIPTQEIIDQLKQECRELGSQAAWAKNHGFSRSFISDVLQGRRDVTEKLANRLGYVKVCAWEKVEEPDYSGVPNPGWMGDYSSTPFGPVDI